MIRMFRGSVMCQMQDAFSKFYHILLRLGSVPEDPIIPYSPSSGNLLPGLCLHTSPHQLHASWVKSQVFSIRYAHLLIFIKISETTKVVI